jgi:hypothetical protein
MKDEEVGAIADMLYEDLCEQYERDQQLTFSQLKAGAENMINELGADYNPAAVISAM